MARTAALMIQIATGDPRPIVRQITDAIRMRIASVICRTMGRGSPVAIWIISAAVRATSSLLLMCTNTNSTVAFDGCPARLADRHGACIGRRLFLSDLY